MSTKLSEKPGMIGVFQLVVIVKELKAQRPPVLMKNVMK